MKCSRCHNDAVMENFKSSEGRQYYLCNECFKELFVYQNTESDKCATCGRALNDEFYLDKHMRKFCSEDCIIRLNGYDWIKENYD